MSTKLPRILKALTTVGIGLLAVGVIAIIVLAVFFADGDGTNTRELIALPLQFTIDADAYSLSGESWGAGEITRASGMATFNDPGPGLAIAAAATVIAGAAAALFALVLLRRIFDTMTIGTPFLPENATRIRWLGFIAIGVAVVEQVIEIGLGLLVLDNVSSSGLDIDYHFDLNLGAVFVGLIILALAEVFRHGTSLQAESDLTV